ncbi:unnamed protein product [Phytophthora fragariaefolia]|uniref:Unnamed protein product n=1 Tax=Phytophthora fragariaefolia TaxID=1490495 RepID=A0A9W7D5X3_9STRA|nr:unnamed protein product [Phytophthora fragariaefolia]
MAYIYGSTSTATSFSFIVPDNFALQSFFNLPLRNQVSPFALNQLVHELAANYDVIPLTEFVDNVACPDLDISLMEYFFELADDVNDGKFIVPHWKLIEYGVARSSQSAAMKKRLENLGLLDGKDYLLNHMSEQLPSGTKHSIMHLLTPEAFKKCFMRAKRARNLEADPVRLERRNEILGKKNRILTEKNGNLLDKVNTLLVNNETLLASNETLVANNIELKSMNIDQMKNINKLLKYADHSKQQIAALHDKLDAMFDLTTEFARMTLPMWVGSSVFPFYEKTLPLCQEYIDGHVKELGDGYIYARPSKKQILREDLKHHRYSDVVYALMLLNQILVSDNGSEEIDRMVRLGVITREDARDLIRLGKSVVKVEDVKLTKDMLEQADEVERACEEI